jgi:mRNA interferase MazF
MILQGDIFYADLNPVQGHEQAYFRPVLILQNKILNENLNTVIIAPITSNLQAKGKYTTYFLDKKISKLPKDSVVLLHQIRTIDKARLRQKLETLDKNTFTQVREQLEIIF